MRLVDKYGIFSVLTVKGTILKAKYKKKKHKVSKITKCVIRNYYTLPKIPKKIFVEGLKPIYKKTPKKKKKKIKKK